MIVFLSALAACVLPRAIADDHYAAQNGQTPAGAYTTWASAASNIQDAVNAATTNDTVWVGAGRYTVPPNATNFAGTNVVFINRPLTLRSSNGVPESTVIDGQATNRGVVFYYPNNTTNRLAIDGFTVSNCFATNIGGGILFYALERSWTGEVVNCIINDNIVAWGTNSEFSYHKTGSSGAGIGDFNNACGFGLTVTNTIIRNNRALPRGEAFTDAGDGGAISHRSIYGEVLIKGCLIESNEATMAAGFNNGGSHITIENTVFRYNRAYTNGSGCSSFTPGGGAMEGGNFTLLNCLIYNNNAYRAGGIYITTGSNYFYNSTIVSNRSYSGAGGINMRFVTHANSAHLRIWNSIIYSNNIPNIQVDGFTNITPDGRLSLQITNSCFLTNSLSFATNFNLYAAGKGNITNNPRFVNFANEDFRLRYDSPCLNTGTNDDWMTNSADLDGRARVRYGTVDMGAYELTYDGTVYMVK
jgi:hypothetical protein